MRKNLERPGAGFQKNSSVTSLLVQVFVAGLRSIPSNKPLRIGIWKVTLKKRKFNLKPSTSRVSALFFFYKIAFMSYTLWLA